METNQNDLNDSSFKAQPKLIDLDELDTWIIHENDDYIVINKPGWVVCHPSKNGPCSSLVGACKAKLKTASLHLVHRLDRETSGVVVLAKHKQMARLLQVALEKRTVTKLYIGILENEMRQHHHVCSGLKPDLASCVYAKQTIDLSPEAALAITDFQPISCSNGFTLAHIQPITGKKHQIRAHAQWINHAIVGDKVYGPDANLFLIFRENGWTDQLATTLPMPRQALHASRIIFDTPTGVYDFYAPLPDDMAFFCNQKGLR